MIRKFITPCCVHNTNFFFRKTILVCAFSSKPKAKCSIIQYKLDFFLYRHDILREINKHLASSDALSLFSLNKLFRTQVFNLKLNISKLYTNEDCRRLSYFIENNKSPFLCCISRLNFIYVNYHNKEAVQALLNLLPTAFPHLTSLSFRGIWKAITVPALGLTYLSLGKIWAPITLMSLPKLSSLDFDKVTNQPDTEAMLKNLQKTIKSRQCGEEMDKTRTL